jgi:hypothetical protein
MDKPTYLRDQQCLDELTERDALRIADGDQGLVHIGVKLRAYVLTLKAQGALQMSGRISCSPTTPSGTPVRSTQPSLAADSLRARSWLALRRDFTLIS